MSRIYLVPRISYLIVNPSALENRAGYAVAGMSGVSDHLTRIDPLVAVSCAVALVIYEHLVLLKYEVEFLWTRKWSAVTWIFLLNRYFLLTNVLFAISPALPQVSHMMDVYGTTVLLKLSRCKLLYWVAYVV